MPLITQFYQAANEHAGDAVFVAAALCAGLYPNIAVSKLGNPNTFATKAARRIKIHQSSAASARGDAKRHRFIVFSEITRTNGCTVLRSVCNSPTSNDLFCAVHRD